MNFWIILFVILDLNDWIKFMDSILVIAAHPDDEILGCGGAIARHSEDGDFVRVIIVSTGITSRSKNSSCDIHEEELSALKLASEKGNTDK